MALSIPIISEFDGKGIKRAKEEFKRLETVGQKAQFAIRKAAIPAALAIGALGAAAKSALAAGEEVNSANNRIRQINKSMGLFGTQTEIVNKRLIKLAEAQARELGISNLTIKATKAKLLTFKNLAQSANVVGGAFDRANRAALDLAAAGFGSAEGNAVQLGKALEDPIKGLAALTRSGINFTDQEKEKIKTLVESNRILEAQEMVLEAIEKQVGGTAKATADDTKRMQEGFAQVRQQIGMALLPALEKITPILINMASWIERNAATVVAAGLVFGGFATAILAARAALVAYRAVALATAGVNAVLAASGFAVQISTGVGIVTAIAGVAALAGITYKLRNMFKGDSIGGDGFSGLNIPQMADGGIIKASPGGTLALIGEGGKDEAVIPLDRMGGMGGNNITINVQGADPNAVVDALRTYMFRNGSVPIRVS
jgi:hypothetical protein